MRHIVTHARGSDVDEFLGIIGAGSVAAIAPATGWTSLETGVAGGHAAAAYDPKAKFEVVVHEVELRRNRAGRTLMARVYQPSGPGPFPAVLDLHGGAWNAKDRRAEEPMDRALAASGLLVVAIDLTLAPEAPYPACVQDANYGVRWLKWKAPLWNGIPSKVGIYASSSGGHVAELLAMRPTDPRYNAIPLAEASQQSTPAWPTWRCGRRSATHSRAFKNAESLKRDAMMANHKTFFVPWETIFEANPQQMLERHEKVTLVPLLIMQGALDDNVLPSVQEKFAATYKAAGGACEYHVFEEAVHEWVANPGPQTDRAREMVKAFIARQLKSQLKSYALRPVGRHDSRRRAVRRGEEAGAHRRGILCRRSGGACAPPWTTLRRSRMAACPTRSATASSTRFTIAHWLSSGTLLEHRRRSRIFRWTMGFRQSSRR